MLGENPIKNKILTLSTFVTKEKYLFITQREIDKNFSIKRNKKPEQIFHFDYTSTMEHVILANLGVLISHESVSCHITFTTTLH